MNKSIISGVLLALCTGTFAHAQLIVETSQYSWHGDSITQGPFTAYAPTPFEIISDYSAQPGYYMGVDKTWKLKNDISAYPTLSTPNVLHHAVYNMALDEMVNAVEPDTTLRTGKEWAGVWTRDVSYSILLSMAYMQPEASMISLRKKVDSLGRIIQDTGSGGAWPVSTDRQIWGIAAWEIYNVTGDRKWLEYIYPIVKRSLETDREAFYDTSTGLVKGETSFIDWREQSHPRWMQCADIYNTETLSTSVVHARAWQVLGLMAMILDHKDVAKQAMLQSIRISMAINKYLWLEEQGYYAMYLYGRDNLIVNPRAETLGEALAILWNIADADRAKKISISNPATPFGTATFYPFIDDIPSYHNKSLWPWVASWWAMASAKAGNEIGVLQAIGSVVRPAALFCTNKENINLENGDISTELNSSNMLWCLSGNIALTHKVLFGIDFKSEGLAFHPFVPKALGAERRLTNFRYRDAVLDITIRGYGNKIKSFIVDGKEQKPFIAADKARGKIKVDITLADVDIDYLGITTAEAASAPLTPITWLEGTTLRWNPIEYINHYIIVKNGERIATTHATTYDASAPGEYQVIGVDDKGLESFASQTRSTRPDIYIDLGATDSDKTTVIDIPVNVPAEGNYYITFEYANGNGPVNTENKCAIRTLDVDGKRAGIIVLPQRGRDNWEDVGESNSLRVHLGAGQHILKLYFAPDNENMNIDTNHARIHGVHLVHQP